ncbi:MAG: signal peptide peptidase SppA [Bacteroidota bacterium]|nr:signal peptide peptidase SppA [Bacteroidota bacterium]
MSKFLKYVLATIVGIFLFFILSIILLLLMISFSMPDLEERLANKPILRITLNKNITERETDDVFARFTSPFSTGDAGTMGLLELRNAIKKASNTSNIKGILLEIKEFNAGITQIEEIRNELIQFKKSGKFVYAYSDNYSQKGYYLATIADKIFLSPHGNLEFNGLEAKVLFIAGTLERLNLKTEIFRVGEYKSAIETFTNKKMSDESKVQTKELLNSVFNSFLDNISQARGIKVQQLKNVADSLMLRTAEDAKRLSFITHFAYFDSLESIIREDVGIENNKKIEYATYADFYPMYENSNGMRKVAVVIAEGQIIMGPGKRGVIGAETFTEVINKARLDENVKAIVIRINSPGGSALASDIIWREIDLANRTKPVIASMSDVAASGGYYIAAACDTILSHPSTITGSIGVFGLILTGEEFMEDKMGITSDVVKTSPFADIGSFTREMTDKERAIIQNSVERIYEQFLQVVAKGRDLERNDVHNVAQGRVWSGKDAAKNKLVDAFGGLDDAIKLAAQKANLDDNYSVVYLPEVEYPLINQLLMRFFGSQGKEIFEDHLGQFTPYIKSLKNLKDKVGIQMRMPYDMVID